MTSSSAYWIGAKHLARSAGVSVRAARQALARSLDGRPWRGHLLVVRTVHGKGGRRGAQYQVRVDSLPADIQTACRDLIVREDRPSTPNRVFDHRPEIANARLEVIKRALKHPSKSSERAREIDELTARSWPWPDGKTRRFSARTIRGWLAAFEREGLAGLRQDRRADHAKKRVFISRAWDSAVDIDEQSKGRIEDTLRRHVRGLWHGRFATAGASRIAEHAKNRLLELTEEVVVDLDFAELRRICRVPKEFVYEEADHRKVSQFDYDKKAHADSAPRIDRTSEGIAPMQIIMGDVHPIDILYKRPDGSTATPKGIAWLDIGTNRIFMYPVFLAEGEGVRQEHVIEAFIAMVLDEAWGMPGSIYIDNGAEYRWMRLIEDGMRLSLEVICRDENGDWSRGSSITKSLPYRPQSKGSIEGAFGQLERRFFSALPGWIGGDRMVKKSANLGHDPLPYPGSPLELGHDILRQVAAYNETAQNYGRLDGLSPNEKLRQSTVALRVEFSFEQLAAVFCNREVRKVRQGRISCGGVRYYHDELIKLNGDRVEIGIPLIRDKSRLLVFDQAGTHRCTVEPDNLYEYGDKSGAVEQARRAKFERDHIADLRSQGERINYREVLDREFERLPEPPKIKSGGVMTISDELEKAGRELTAPPLTEKERLDKEERERAEQSRVLDLIANPKRAAGGNRRP